MRDLFMAEELVRDFGRAVNTNKLMGRATAVFPAVTFSCAGSITAWTAAGNFRNRQDDVPQLGTCSQPCSSESEVSFGASSQNQSERLRCGGKGGEKCVYQFTLEQLLHFVENDTVVIKQPKHTLLEVFYSGGRERRRRMPQQSLRQLTNSVPLITFGKLMFYKASQPRGRASVLDSTLHPLTPQQHILPYIIQYYIPMYCVPIFPHKYCIFPYLCLHVFPYTTHTSYALAPSAPVYMHMYVYTIAYSRAHV